MREIKFRGLNLITGDWVYGGYLKHQKITPSPIGYRKTESDFQHLILKSGFSDWNMPKPVEVVEVDSETIGQYTGLRDKNGKEIYEGDIVSIKFDEDETRHFEVAIETVVRKLVSHPSFIDKTAKVEITGVVFKWNNFELFPCIENGISDTSKMVVVGNIYENPELLEENL